MTLNVDIPIALIDEKKQPLLLNISAGSSIVIVGANGSGKTRLAVYIEKQLGLKAHRIAAHRALSLNPDVNIVSEKSAAIAIETGRLVAAGWNLLELRTVERWKKRPATALLNDFDALIQRLYAEQTNITQITHKKARAGELRCIDPTTIEETKFEKLAKIWDKLLSPKKLEISGDDIQVSIEKSDTTKNPEIKYSASEMSDGERSVFYMIAQVLCIKQDSLLIIDEPELHIHKSIISNLWDELEAIRPDCAFLFITHDIDFACSRVATKYVIKNFVSSPSPCWDIEQIQDDIGFDESTLTLILGSKKPLLFIEGCTSSLDNTIYRCCYPNWTIIPTGSCEDVIHVIATMKKHETLTRLQCAGIIDADDRSDQEISELKEKNIYVIAVSEIENIFLLPNISKVILESEHYSKDDIQQKFEELKNVLFDTLKEENRESAIKRYIQRRIDRELKIIDLSSANSVQEIESLLNNKIKDLIFKDIYKNIKNKIEAARRDKNLEELLKIYDNKGLLNEAARHLKKMKLNDFKDWLSRVLRSENGKKLRLELKKVLPKIEIKP